MTAQTTSRARGINNVRLVFLMICGLAAMVALAPSAQAAPRPGQKAPPRPVTQPPAHGAGKALAGAALPGLSGPAAVSTGALAAPGLPPLAPRPRATRRPAAQRISDALGRAGGCIQRRYQCFLKRSPMTSGTVELCATVSATGRVLRVRAGKDTIGDAPLAAALGACVKRVRFPALRGGAQICAPFSLQTHRR